MVYLDKKLDKEPVVKPNNLKKSQHKDDEGNPWNYIYPDGDAFHMVLGDYKTIKTYGLYQIALPADLSKVIKGYMKKNNVKHGEYLIRNQCCGKAGGQGFSRYFRLPHCFQAHCAGDLASAGPWHSSRVPTAFPCPWPVGERDSGARSHGELAPKGSLPLARHLGGERGLFLQHSSPPDP
jgi:hypothetical protein